MNGRWVDKIHVQAETVYSLANRRVAVGDRRGVEASILDNGLRFRFGWGSEPVSTDWGIENLGQRIATPKERTSSPKTFGRDAIDSYGPECAVLSLRVVLGGVEGNESGVVWPDHRVNKLLAVRME